MISQTGLLGCLLPHTLSSHFMGTY